MRAYDVDKTDWTHEPDYNAYSHRFFPFDGMTPQDWGGAWVKVLPGDTLTSHHHEEHEIFFVVRGTGMLTLGDETRRVQYGSTVAMDWDVPHSLVNDGTEELVFLSVWWEGPTEISENAA